MTTKPIIIDCDPGVDDAIALLLAFASPELEVLGITTVGGNVSATTTAYNARQICELANRSDAKVFAGCPRPMMRSLETAEQVHGEGGLGGVRLPEPTMPLQSTHGVDFLIDTLMASHGEITLATLGPLTNLAIALIKAPQIIPKIKEVVLMGGALTHGNVTPCAEFNIYTDPHAAHVVFSSGLPLTMFGLDLTHQVLTTPARLERMRQVGTPAAIAAAEMLAFYGTHERAQGMEGGPLHDPCVIAYLIQPELFTCKPFHVEVEIHSPLTMGQTVVDRIQSGDRKAMHPPNANVAIAANAEGFYDLLISRL